MMEKKTIEFSATMVGITREQAEKLLEIIYAFGEALGAETVCHLVEAEDDGEEETGSVS